MARRMTARYRGTCGDCGGGIRPGDQIVYRGRGDSAHADCDAAEGMTYKQRYGRCEDAPCCGCCGTNLYDNGTAYLITAY